MRLANLLNPRVPQVPMVPKVTAGMYKGITSSDLAEFVAERRPP